MQNYNALKASDLLSNSRATINNNEECLKSNFSGTYFPTSDLVDGMFCWRTDLRKMYQYKEDTGQWLLVFSMSEGQCRTQYANEAVYANKDGNGDDIAETYYRQDSLTALKSALFPVGSIYLTMTNTNPSTWLGGEWQQIAGGRVLIGASSSYAAGSTGGSEKVASSGSISDTTVSVSGSVGSTTLNVNQIPAHSHNIDHYHAFGYHNGDNNGRFLSTGGSTGNYNIVDGGTAAYWNGSGGGGSSGQATNPNNLITSLATRNGSGAYSDNTGGTQGHTHSITASSTAHNHTFTGSASSVMQPYLVVYYWQRVK